MAGLQAGTDLWARGNWRAGAHVGYLGGNADVSGNAVASSPKATSPLQRRRGAAQ
ncbi:hypothetical protein WKW79_33625 [Variovorax robiniae]|uniref:Uncharacterized protein n=1 Tax=Variovorax robiniae TaxID=1836199 RepID=A0ABU8XIM9_9BURK